MCRDRKVPKTCCINNDTADGFGEDKIQKFIESLRSESYRPNPFRRTYIQKKNSKKSPSWDSDLFGQAGAGSTANDFRGDL